MVWYKNPFFRSSIGVPLAHLINPVRTG